MLSRRKREELLSIRPKSSDNPTLIEMLVPKLRRRPYDGVHVSRVVVPHGAGGEPPFLCQYRVR